MSLSLAKLTCDDAIKALAHGLGCVSDVRAIQMALAADHIRSALYANAVRTSAQDTSAALHTTRLLTGVRKTFDLLWPRSAVIGPYGQDDSAQLALDALALVGDVVDTGGGFWLGTPLRLIQNPGNTSLLILGALPSFAVKSICGVDPFSTGAHRSCFQSPSSNESAFVQSIDEWLDCEDPLDTWTQKVLDTHRAKLSSTNDVTADQLEIYAPDIFLSRRQNGRWLEARQLTQGIDGLRLCRPIASASREWARPYYLGEFGFRSGQATLSRGTSVKFDLTLRLRFGLDKILQAPRRIILFTRKDTFDLDLPYDLPNPERRVLGLGWPSGTRDRRLTFHISTKPILSRAFERLGVFVEARGGDNVNQQH